MSEVETQKLQTETREAIEFIELLKSLTRDEKNQVKGYITCLRSVKNIKTEEDYIQTMNKYEPDERHKLVELAGMLTNAFEEDMCDMLGDIYMESAAGNKNLGQFFTPFHLSYACAACTLPEDISEDNPFHINEPSIGGGGMIIAAAKVLKERGLNYQRCMKVVGQDLDWRGVYMAYVQLSLLGIDAIVVQGNTLAEPYIKGYDRSRMLRTPMDMGVIL